MAILERDNFATTAKNLSNVPAGGRGFKFEYPLDNKEFPARIIFAVIPNLDTAGVVSSAANLVSMGVLTANNFVDANAKDETFPISSETTTLGVDEKGRTSVSSTVENVKSWVQKQAAFYGKIEEQPAHILGHDLTSDEVHLYLPRAISINDAASYDTGFQLGTIGGVAEMALTSGTNVMGAVTGAVVGSAIAEGKSFMGGSGMSSGMADILAQKRIAKMGAAGAAVAGGMTAASKVTTNPNTKAMFKDVPLRSFSFNFTLVPTSAREAQEIDNIVKLFRTELYPTTLAAGKIRVGYKFPNRFKITLKSGISEKKQNRSIEKHNMFNREMGVRFLPTYLTSFGAVYNAGSSMIHNDGHFNQVDISLAFTETRALTKADVRDGGY